MFKGKPFFRGSHLSRSAIGVPLAPNFTFDPPPPVPLTTWEVSAAFLKHLVFHPNAHVFPAFAYADYWRTGAPKEERGVQLNLRLWGLLDLYFRGVP